MSKENQGYFVIVDKKNLYIGFGNLENRFVF